MACTLTSESRRLYSWWWDSHITPKNSKWLQENLTDMDTKVKSMIKLIEEDADSFARRAEMYYKKRPELMKLVEEFYRAYRALAERYDYATSELRHAQKTLQAAFPDQEPFTLPEDSSSSTDVDAQKNGPSSFQLFVEPKLQSTNEKDESEVERLKKAVADLITEKDSLFIQYQSSLGKLSNANGELIRAQESFKILEEKAKEVEKEIHMLKETLGLLMRSKSENDVDLLEKKIVIMEEEANLLSEQAVKAQSEVEKLKGTLLELTEEKEALRIVYVECLEKSFKLELDLSSAQSDVQRLTVEILNSTKKLKHVEEICVCLETSNQSLKTEVSDLAKNIVLKDLELSDKQDVLKNTEVECSNMQKEIFNLKEEIKKLNMSYSLLTGQLELGGLDQDSFGSSVKHLRDENSRLKQIYEKRLDELENHIQELHKESKLKKQEFQEELEKAVIAQFENFILHKFVKEVEEENHALSVENEKHIEACNLSDKLISELETEILEQQVEEELLLVEVENLRFGIYKVVLSLEISSNCEKISIEEIIGNINDLKHSLAKEEDDKQRVRIENAVISTLIHQIKSEFQESESYNETMKDEFFKIKKENLDLIEVNENLGLELNMLDVEIEERKNIEVNLTSELQERKNESELWNTEAARLIYDLNVSNTLEILYESKVHELDEVCETVEGETALKDREIEEMKQKARVMEREIEGLKAQLLAYTPVIGSLKENILSLEHNVFTMENLTVSNNRKAENVEAKVHPHHNQRDPGPTLLEPNGISDLIEVQTRIASLEKIIVKDINTIRMRKNSGLTIKPKLPKTETEESKSNKEEKLRRKQRYLTLDHPAITKPTPDLSEVRDIQLDQASDGSSSANSRSRSRRGYLRSDDMLIEQLQIAHNSKLPYEPQIEDLGFYRLQVSNQESKKGKLLQRSTSDANKLANLETTVKDLAERLEVVKKIKKPTRVDYKNLKEQLERAEETILELVNLNAKSIASIEKNPKQDDSWKCSERIKTVQMDVQKIQCLLSKLDDEKNSKLKSGFLMSKNRTGVILRDFIHQGRNNNGRIRRRHLCGCFAPSPSRSDRVKF